MPRERRDEKELASKLRELGPSQAVENFLSKYGNTKTKALYASQLALYFRWLNSKGVLMTPDELLKDNLVRVFRSDPTDVLTKKYHTNLLNEYVNKHLLSMDCSEAKRKLAATAIRMLYRTNDSELFGYYETANQELEAPPRPLFAEDIRKVLVAMSVRSRAPLLISWQSGIEINRVLGMDGRFPIEGNTTPVRLDFPGRKGHRKAFHTFMGRDSVEAIRMLGARRFATYDVVRENLREAARRLASKGLLKNPDPPSWHPHALRHSFKTEAEHAGLKSGIVEFFCGHVKGIEWVYDHRDEVHPDDLSSAYLKLEPFVSLNPDRVIVSEEFIGRERELRTEIDLLKGLYDQLKEELRASRSERPSQRSGG